MSEEIEGNVIYIPVEIRSKTKEIVNQLSKEVNDIHKKLSEVVQVKNQVPAATEILEQEQPTESEESQTQTEEDESFFDKLTNVQTSPSESSLTPGQEQKTTESNEEDKAIQDLLKNEIGNDINDAMETETKPGGKLSIQSLFKQAGMTNPEDAIETITNPFAKIMSLARTVPILGGVMAAGSMGFEAAQELFQVLTSRGMPFDLHFRRVINNENDELVSRQQTMAIHLGMDQIIAVNTKSQKFNPNFTVNTLQEVRNKEIYQQNQWRIRKGYVY